MNTDPITDMLNRIRNAQAVRHETVDVPFSKLKGEIARVLKKQGFVEEIEKRRRAGKPVLRLVLKYQDEKGVISGLRRISKPGQRVMVRAKKIRRVKGGAGIAVVSTTKGLMTDKEARKQKLGGEILCEIW